MNISHKLQAMPGMLFPRAHFGFHVLKDNIFLSNSTLTNTSLFPRKFSSTVLLSSSMPQYVSVKKNVYSIMWNNLPCGQNIWLAQIQNFRGSSTLILQRKQKWYKWATLWSLLMQTNCLIYIFLTKLIIRCFHTWNYLFSICCINGHFL